MIKHLILSILLGSLISPCLADTSWQKNLSKAPAGPFKKKKKSKLYYTLTWKGSIKAGETVVAFEKNNGKSSPVKVECSGYTSGLARKVFPYDFFLKSKYNGNTLAPIQYEIWEQNKDEAKQLYGKFRGNTVKVSEIVTPNDTKTPVKSTETFSYPRLFDIYSSILYVGSQPLNNGDDINMLLFPFDKPYLARLKVLGREKHLGHDCIKLDLKLNKVKSDLTLKNYEKFKKAELWITDNSDRIMVELRSEIFIGDVRTTLVKTEW